MVNLLRFLSFNQMRLIIIVLICLGSRLIFIGKRLEGWDDVDFALALHEYDLTAFQPHFPGYIIYIALARLTLFFTNNDLLSLVLPNVIFGSLTIIPLYLLASNIFSKKVGLLSALLYIINPLCWLQAERPLPDATGVFFIILSLQLMYFSLKRNSHSVAYMIASSLVLGIAFGIKMSYLPFIFTWFFALRLAVRGSTRHHKGLNSISNSPSNIPSFKKIIYPCAGAFAIGISIWLIPLMAIAGPYNLFAEGINFSYGHFFDWGGSIVTENNLLSRFIDIYWIVFVNGLGLWWMDTDLMRLVPSVIILIISLISIFPFFSQVKPFGQHFIATEHTEDSENNFSVTSVANFEIPIRGLRVAGPFSPLLETCKFLAAFILPYLIWIFFGQNLDKPRHALPLIPILLILISAGAIKSNIHIAPKIAIIGILLCSFGAISLDLILKHRDLLPTQLQLINYVKDNFDDDSTRIYCWETKRMFEYYAPTWDVRRVRNIADLDYDLNSSLTIPQYILCTSKVQGLENYGKNITFLREFVQDRYVDTTYNKLILYRIDKNEQ